MESELPANKIERFIIEVLRERKSLPLKERPIPEEELILIVVKKFGDGDISGTISQVIEYLEHGKFKLLRTSNGKMLEINER